MHTNKEIKFENEKQIYMKYLEKALTPRKTYDAIKSDKNQSL